METKPPKLDTERLLADLRSEDPACRQAAVNQIARQPMSDERIIAALKKLAATDLDWRVSYAARNALGSRGAPVVASSDASLYSRYQKQIDFAIGFAGWYVGNGVAYVAAGAPSSPGQAYAVMPLIWLVNLIALLVLGLTRRWVALGLLVAIALNYLISTALGLLFNANCFVPFFIPGIP